MERQFHRAGTAATTAALTGKACDTLGVILSDYSAVFKIYSFWCIAGVAVVLIYKTAEVRTRISTSFFLAFFIAYEGKFLQMRRDIILLKKHGRSGFGYNI